MKLKKNNFLEGAFIASFCIIITKILGIVYVIPFYKIIGEQGGTLYGYAYTIYNIFLTISSVGIPLAISKLTSEYTALNMNNKRARTYQISTKIILIFSVISFLICFTFAPNLSNLLIGELEGGNTIQDVTFVIRVISFAILIIPWLSIERGYLQGLRFIKEPSISQIIEQGVRILIIIVGSYLCVNIFNLPIRYAVGISVGAAALGGIATFIYLHLIVHKNKKDIGLDIKPVKNKEEDKEIIKKIIFYSLPFVVINLANSIYTTTDLFLVLRTLPKLGYTAEVTEYIGSVFSTWGIKFNTIVMSLCTGLVISLIPNIVKQYQEKDLSGVNDNFNKCIKLVLLILLPLALYMSGMSQSMWRIFYGNNIYGETIIKFTVLVTVIDCMYTVINSLLQSLNKTKIIYFSIITGIVLNLILDIPLMTLFNKLNINAYYGAILATFIGTITSVIISLIYLNKQIKFNYKETIKVIPRLIISLIFIIIMTKIFNIILPVTTGGRLMQIINVLVSGLVTGGLYLVINFKYIKEILPSSLARKLKIKMN